MNRKPEAYVILSFLQRKFICLFKILGVWNDEACLDDKLEMLMPKLPLKGVNLLLFHKYIPPGREKNAVIHSHIGKLCSHPIYFSLSSE